MDTSQDDVNRTPPKQIVDVKIFEDEFGSLYFGVCLADKGRSWLAVFVDPEAEMAIATVKEKVDTLDDFYNSKSDVRMKSTKGLFKWGPFAGMMHHLQFVLITMQIRSMSLDYPESPVWKMWIKLIEKLFKDNMTEIEELNLRGRSQARIELDPALLQACNPKSLVAEYCSTFESFYMDPTILKLQKLNMSGEQTIDDDELLRLSASSIELSFWERPMLTTLGIKAFLAQWAKCERDISRVDLTFEMNTICMEEDWKELLQEVHPNLVTATVRNNVYVILRREADNATVHARYTDYRITLEAETNIDT